MHFRHWRLFFALKLFSCLALSAVLLLYTGSHGATPLGIITFVLGTCALLALIFYVGRYTFRMARRNGRKGNNRNTKVVVPYERFKDKRGVG